MMAVAKDHEYSCAVFVRATLFKLICFLRVLLHRPPFPEQVLSVRCL